MSKHIVISTYGSLGDLNPFLPVAQLLKEHGHRVVIATDDFYQTYIESAGLEFRCAHRGFLYGLETLETQPLFSIRNSYDELTAVARSADLLITHQAAFAGPLVAGRSRIPWISVALTPFTFNSDYFPLSFGVASSHPINSTVYKVYLNQMKQWSRLRTREIQHVRRELGLPPAQNMLFADHHSPDLILAFFSSVFSVSEVPPQTIVTGFPFNEPLAGVELPRELASFLDDGPPPIVFTLGSDAFTDTSTFYRESALAASLLRRRAVLVNPATPGVRVSLNSISVNAAPFGSLFSRAAAVVHHGGIGSIALAMRAGCPMLLLPAVYWDQPDNAARATDLGVARMLARHDYNRFSAATELAQLLYDPKYAARCAEVARVVQAEDGVRSACDAIERYLS